jgi:large conductance mechanosensitive channel
MRGNVADIAVGIVIGGAFGKIITSFVNDVVMPPIGLMVGNVNFSQLFVNLGDGAYSTLAEAQEAGAATINYGVFLQTIFDFLIVALAIFMVVKQMNKMKKQEEAVPPPAPPAPTKDQDLLTEIRDLLRK